MDKKSVRSEIVTLDDKVFAFIGYLWILFLIPLFYRKDSKFAQYHSKQGAVLFGLWFISWLVDEVVLVGSILGLLVLVWWIIGVLNVLLGKYRPLPIFGIIGEKIKV